MDTSNICQVIQYKFTALLKFCWLPVAWSFCNYITVFQKKGFLCWTVCFLWTKHRSIWVDTLLGFIQSAENPHVLYQNPLHFSKAGIQCAVFWKQIMIPLLFDNTITTGNYSNLLTQFIALLKKNQQDCWFSQDGANAHTVQTTKTFLQGIFSNCKKCSEYWTLPARCYFIAMAHTSGIATCTAMFNTETISPLSQHFQGSYSTMGTNSHFQRYNSQGVVLTIQPLQHWGWL